MREGIVSTVLLQHLANDEEGATVVEYAVILTAIAAVIIISVSLVGDKTRNAFDTAGGAFPGDESTPAEQLPPDEDKCKAKDSEDDADCGIGND